MDDKDLEILRLKAKISDLNENIEHLKTSTGSGISAADLKTLVRASYEKFAITSLDVMRILKLDKKEAGAMMIKENWLGVADE